MGLTVTKPGALTRVFRKGPVGLYHLVPTGDVIADIADDCLEDSDGLVMIIAAVGDWRLVLAASGKLGWVDPDDLGPNSISGAVYHID
jgi:hypothetical protein